VKAVQSTETNTGGACAPVSRLTLLCEPVWIGADRFEALALSDEYEEGKERAVINMSASRFDCHVNVQES
jgi:hypothetical protein